METNGSTDKRIAIFVYYQGSLKFHPSIVNSAKLWNERGYGVDIFKCTNPDEGLEQSDAFKVVHACHYESNPFARVKSIRRFIRSSRAYMTGHRYKALIGIDAYGIMIAGILNRSWKTTLVYHSLEILTTKANYDALMKKRWLVRAGYILHHSMLKVIEKHFHRQAFLTVIQDNYRWELLKKVNGLRGNVRFVIVPNTPLDDGKAIAREKGRYLLEKYDLSANDKVILHAGSLGEWTGVGRILDAIDTWPDDTVFVIHGRGPEWYIDLLREKANMTDKRVIISLDQLVEEEYNRLVQSAHIGIAWYTDIEDPNTSAIGAASGKLFYYLKYSLPVITNKWPGLTEIVDGHEVGVCADSEAQIGYAVRQITTNHDRYRSNTRSCFQEYSFGRHYESVIQLIERS